MDLVEWNRIPQVANGIHLIVDLDYDIVMPLATYIYLRVTVSFKLPYHKHFEIARDQLVVINLMTQVQCKANCKHMCYILPV